MIPSSTCRLVMVLIALTPLALSGCSSLHLGTFTLEKGSPKYVGVEAGFGPEAASSAEVYQKVRQALSQNAIVLQLPDDDDNAVRVLPLPSAERSVFVSDLLKQTGVLKKLGHVDVVLYRHSPDTIGGFRMAVQMTPDGDNVRPESDYALRAGDRLTVQKSRRTTLDSLVSTALGL